MNIVAFTGAGISRESGLKTFRDSDGLWEGYQVMDVCSTQALQHHPERVLDFYNDRRREVLAAEPNAAHYALAKLGESHDVVVVTQNIDNLHERAGSKNVIHIHGEITKKRAMGSECLTDCFDNIKIGDKDSNGHQYRPHVVMFGETPWSLDLARTHTRNPDLMILVGTTLAVMPASLLVKKSKVRELFVVDPTPPELNQVNAWGRKVYYIRKVATEGVVEAVEKILAQYIP